MIYSYICEDCGASVEELVLKEKPLHCEARLCRRCYYVAVGVKFLASGLGTDLLKLAQDYPGIREEVVKALLAGKYIAPEKWKFCPRCGFRGEDSGEVDDAGYAVYGCNNRACTCYKYSKTAYFYLEGAGSQMRRR